MVDTVKSILNTPYIRFKIKSVNVSKGDPNIWIQLSGFEQRLICDDVAVVDDDQFRAELAARFEKPSIRRPSTKIAEAKRCVEGRKITVAEVEYLVPVADESVVQLSIGEDSNLAVPPYLEITRQ
jgi:hypothetical protein